MESFNKYKFLQELKEDLRDEFNTSGKYPEPSEDDIEDYVIQYVSNQTIYYYDCWRICLEFQPNDFENPSTGRKAKNISQLAFGCLFDYVMQDVQNFNETKEKKLPANDAT